MAADRAVGVGGHRILLAAWGTSDALAVILAAVAVINVLSATQDIATDGLAVAELGPRQRGIGNGIQLGAYRIGMIAGSGGLLWVYSLSGWRTVFVVIGVLVLITTPGVWRLPRTRTNPAASTEGRQPKELVTEWMTRLRRPGVMVFIALIASFKFGDSMGSSVVSPFMVDAGLSIGQIALIKGALSSAATLAGAAIGGWLAYRVGRRRALLVGGVAQTVSLALYLVAALGFGGFGLIVSAILAEHLLGGMATVAVFTLMMDASQREHAGADYTLLACAVAITQGISGLVGGVIGDAVGYPLLFAVSLALSGIGCAVLITSLDRGAGPSGVREVWAPGSARA